MNEVGMNRNQNMGQSGDRGRRGSEGERERKKDRKRETEREWARGRGGERERETEKEGKRVATSKRKGIHVFNPRLLWLSGYITLLSGHGLGIAYPSRDLPI